MHYKMTTPCDACPFLVSMKRGFTIHRLTEFADGAFPCHKTAESVEDGDGNDEFRATPDSAACAGALIFCEKRGYASQMMRIAERIGSYDPTRLNMNALVR